MTADSIDIMVFGAHPADPFERAGGTVAKHLERGDRAVFVSLTSGAVTHAFTSFPETGDDKLKNMPQVVEEKRDEFARAADALGIQEWVMLDFNESPLLVGLNEYITLVNLIREHRPDIVITSHPVEVGRQDHMDAGRFTVAAVDYARAEGFPSPLAPHSVPELFLTYYQDFRSEQLMGSPRQAPEVIVDISTVVSRKREAMMQFATTQAQEGEDYSAKLDLFFKRQYGSGGALHGFDYAECFSRWNPELTQYLPMNG